MHIVSWENLLKHQDILSLVIIFLILMTCMFEQVVIVRRNKLLVSTGSERVNAKHFFKEKEKSHSCRTWDRVRFFHQNVLKFRV